MCWFWRKMSIAHAYFIHKEQNKSKIKSEFYDSPGPFEYEKFHVKEMIMLMFDAHNSCLMRHVNMLDYAHLLLLILCFFMLKEI
ncbi:CLUMA_CG002732, isoform A [Clunio marinus]|uniref:CLUMA_CG002732, isoform A n=1 Tax=Clunio marinus TaxID=568069 RepID=A0A1J1HNP0_9DIPT|nr:CLUMA_CG002732, isoform A [Clunio marinus]